MNYYGYEFIRESDLTHHGIKGQKWGVRRFQNEDMTWTAAGKERYGDGNVADAKSAYKAAKKAYNKSFNKAYYHNHPFSFSKKKREESQERWNDAYDKAQKLGEAKRVYKTAKKNAAQNKKADRKAIKAEKKATRLARIYELNEHTYTRLGNKTMASMNRAAKNEQLKKAAQSRQARLGRSAVSRSR